MRTWLEGLGLGEYAGAFEAERIDFEALAELSDLDLKELGLPMGPRRKLLKAIPTLAPAAEREAPAPHRAGAERRQITVMFCDLVGSTALSESLDPEDLRALMAAYRDAAAAAIERYDGHVAQYLGDGVMAYFGWPRAHEDDAERAVRAGLDVVAAVKDVESPRPLEVRIGIGTGPVVVGEADGARGDSRLAVGETPNLAARLQGCAGPDEIVIAPATRRLVGGAFDLDDLGARALKGIVDAVRAWRVTGLAHSESRFEAARGAALTPLVGRAAEIALLADRWRRALAGEGQVVLISGEPGIGKSRTITELRARIAEVPHAELAFQCSAYHANTPFYPISEHFARAAGFAGDDTAEARREKLWAHLDRIGMPADEVAPRLAAALSIGAEAASTEASPQARKRTIEALADSLLAVARSKPLLFLVEDLHWSDPSSLELVGHIIERIHGARFLAILSHRPDFAPPWRNADHVTALALNRLGRSDVARMIERVTGGRPMPDEVVAHVAARTDGVPLFVEELTRAMIDSGMVAPRDGAYVLAGPIAELDIPATLHDSLMARLDRLGAAKEVAQIAACIGREFAHELLAAVAAVPAQALATALGRLMESALVSATGSGPEAVYAFRHALIQDAAERSLLRPRRRAVHTRIAEALEQWTDTGRNVEPEVLAHHWHAAGAPERALRHWREAARRAAARGATHEAITQLETATTALEALPDSETVLQHRLEVPVELASQMRVVGEFSRALSLLKGAHTLGKHKRRTLELARINQCYGNICFAVGRYKECDARHSRALALARKARSPRDEARALGGLGDAAYATGQMRAAFRHFDDCVAICRTHVISDIEPANLAVRGYARVFLNQFAEALADGDEVCRIAPEVGDFRGLILGHGVAGIVLMETGRYEEALERGEIALGITRKIDAVPFATHGHHYIARAHLLAGARREALAEVRKGIALARQHGIASSLPSCLSILARATADASERAVALAEAHAILAKGGLSYDHLNYWRDAMVLCAEAGEWDRVERAVRALQAYTRDEPLPWVDLIAGIGRLQAARGRGQWTDAHAHEARRLRVEVQRIGLVAEQRYLDALLG